MHVIKLHNWALVAISPNTYSEPHQHLKGYRTGEKQPIRTSRIVKIVGALITTESGTVYKLEQPHPTYVAWCRETGCHIPTKNEPIKCA